MGRPKRQIDIDEINEIIDIKLKELNGIVSRLTCRGVSELNKKIANNPEYIRKNGKPFKLYGYDIWANESYPGKKRIMEIQNKNEVRVVGEDFKPEIQDIIKLINDLHTKPEILLTRICRIFEKERMKYEAAEKQIDRLKSENNKLHEKLDAMETGVINLMFMSHSSSNSLNDMLRHSRESDEICYQEFKNMFGKKNEYIEKIFDKNMINRDNTDSSNVIKLNSTTTDYLNRGL